MGARWYNPATGSFGNKDTVTNKPVPDSASASPFGYAADNPLNGTDPTGHMGCPLFICIAGNSSPRDGNGSATTPMDRSHLLAWSLGGKNDRRNLVPLYASANQGFGADQMRGIETQITKTLVTQKVYFFASPIYSGSGNPYIPEAIDVTWGTSANDLRFKVVPNIP
jgi:hypothetical protein